MQAWSVLNENKVYFLEKYIIIPIDHIADNGMIYECAEFHDQLADNEKNGMKKGTASFQVKGLKLLRLGEIRSPPFSR
jgi:hypothetical protein